MRAPIQTPILNGPDQRTLYAALNIITGSKDAPCSVPKPKAPVPGSLHYIDQPIQAHGSCVVDEMKRVAVAEIKNKVSAWG